MTDLAAMSRSLPHLWDVQVPMRDGVRLSMDVYLPPGGLAGGPYPTILKRTPYNKTTLVQAKYLIFLATQGYAACIMDLRGLNGSEGEWRPWFHDGPDGFDAIEWVAQQPWSNGRVGTLGGSYPGWAQWAAARERPPHLRAMVVSGSAAVLDRRVGNFLYGACRVPNIRWLYSMGRRTSRDSSLVDWTAAFHSLPLRDMDRRIGADIPLWNEWNSHHTLDDYWRPLRFTPQDFAGIDIPVCHITGWYDFCQQGSLWFWHGMRHHSPAAGHQRMVIGPWDHFGTVATRTVLDGVDFGASAAMDLDALHLRWFNHWLKGEQNGAMDAPVLRSFQMGSNAWRDVPALPPPAGGSRIFRPGPDGALGSDAGDGSESYRYDPLDPVILDQNVFQIDPAKVMEEPIIDRTQIEERADVLITTSSPLEAPLPVLGLPRVRLLASSDCFDTDFVAWVADVDPAGRSVAISTGFLRARFRRDPNTETLLTPGVAEPMEIPMAMTDHLFQPGHRVRLAITSSAFPQADRNPNTGHPIGQDAETRVATNTIHWAGTALELPLDVG
jgi:hypothetical protein